MAVIDARTLGAVAPKNVDICIIGAGAAGLSIAHALLGTQRNVLLVESGGEIQDPATQALAEGTTNWGSYLPPGRMRARCVGGALNLWNGRFGWPREEDLAERPWIPHSGWPIGHAELQHYYLGAAALLGVPPSEDGQRGSQGILDAVESGIGTTYFSFVRTRELIDELWPIVRRATNVDTLLHANVTELETDDGASRVTRVKVKTLVGNELRIEPRVVVLAGGGIENPRLLLLSNRVCPKGLGNDHDQVGRYFQDHPYINAGTIRLAPGVQLRPEYSEAYAMQVPGRRLPLIATDRSLSEKHRIGNLIAFLDPERQDWAPTREALRRVERSIATGNHRSSGIGAEVNLLVREFRNVLGYGLSGWRSNRVAKPAAPTTYRVRTNAEVLPNPSSRVRLGADTDALGMRRPVIEFSLTAADWRTIELGSKAIGEALVERKLGSFEPSPIGDDGGREIIDWGRHHMCTTRMADDPRQGVVNAQCKVHGVGNLYAAGSSVFSTGCAGVPTATIVALALRLADHLRADH